MYLNKIDFSRLKMITKKLVTVLILMFITASVFTVLFYKYSLNISGEYKVSNAAVPPSEADLKKPLVYIGVISRYPPNIIYRGYQPLLNYMTSKTGYRFELKLSTDYSEAVRMLINGETAAAFLGSYVYLDAHKQYGVLPILKPLNENFEPYSRTVLFTKRSSNLYNLKDLKGRRLALPSKESFSANWLIRHEFPKYGINYSDLASADNFPHHQSVIYQVYNSYYDAGVTREFLVKNLPNRDSIRVILYSDPIPTSPIVVAPNFDASIVSAIKKSLMDVNGRNPAYQIITKEWDSEFIYGFVEASDSDYNILRQIGK